MNLRSCNSLLLAALVALFVEQQVEAGIIGNILPGEFYERIYDRIGKHLDQKFPFGKNPNADLKQAIDWLEAKISSATFSVEKYSLSTVLNQLKALGELKDDEKCNLDSYKALEANNRGTKGLALENRFCFKSKIRIIQMVHHYFKLHAASCNQHYSDLLDSDAGMNKSDLETVRTIRDGYFKGLIRHSKTITWYRTAIHQSAPKPAWKVANEFDANESVREYYRRHVLLISGVKASLLEIQNPEIVLEYLSQNDINHNCLFKEEGKGLDLEKIKALYMKYMVDPCRNYVENKAGIWIMHRFDRKVIDMYRDFDLEKATIGYKVCQNLIGEIQQPLFDRLIERLNRFKAN